MKVLAACGTPVLIDPEDLGVFESYVWRVYKYGRNHRYATTTANGKTLYLHRLIMGAVKGEDVDHENGDGTDCQRSNLRRCTHQQNLCNRRVQANNTSGYMGVSKNAAGNWMARVKHQGKNHYGGSYATKEEAARVRDRMMAAINGVEFSTFNFPDEVVL